MLRTDYSDCRNDMCFMVQKVSDLEVDQEALEVGTCESFFFVRIESRIESVVRFVFESNLRIESAVYHASRNTA